MLYAFDLLEHDGDDLCELPLIERKHRLAQLLGTTKRQTIQFVEHLTEDDPNVFKHVCRMGLEGISGGFAVSKRAVQDVAQVEEPGERGGAAGT